MSDAAEDIVRRATALAAKIPFQTRRGQACAMIGRLMDAFR
jgi:hypothetical protein